MPTVPQYGQREQIGGLPTVRSNLNITPDAYGAQIGRAGQGIAAQVTQYAEREQEKQDTAALMNAERELQSWQNQALFAPETGAFAQRGQNAFGIPDKLMPEWDKRVGEVEGRLTDRQREVFRQRAGNMRVSMERDVMRHVGSEAEAFQKTETAALVGTRMETAMLYWKDPARFDQELREAQGVFLAGNDGLPPAALAAGMQEIESKGRASVVQKMLEEDPLGAQRYFDTWSEKMTAADRAAAERVLKPARIDAEADQEVARATGRGVAPVPPPSDYATYRRKLESGGRADATNPNSSATGADQFVEGTWLEMVRKSKPAWAEGLSRAELLALRKDPDKSAEMAAVYDAENARALTRAGQPVTVHTLYASHHFGSKGGVAFADADMDTPMEDILSPGQIAANGYLRGKTKAEAIANWDKRAGARPGQAPAAAPTDKAGVLTELNQIADPQVRAAAISKYNTQIQIEKVREAEIEQANVESINTKVEAANPAANLRDVLTPQEFAWAAEQGKLPAWEQRMAQRLNGTEPKTDPVVFDALQTMLARAENGDATAIAEVKKMDPTALFTKLDKQARDYVQNRRLAIVGADKKKGDDAPDFATEDDLLNVEVFDKLGISKNANKDDSEETKATRVQFMQSYWATVEAHQAEKGKKLTAGEKQAIMKELLLPFARKVQDSFLYFDSTEEKRAFEIGNVPAVDRQQIVEAFKRVHGVQPSDAQVRAAYLRAQGYTPKLEAE